MLALRRCESSALSFTTVGFAGHDLPAATIPVHRLSHALLWFSIPWTASPGAFRPGRTCASAQTALPDPRQGNRQAVLAHHLGKRPGADVGRGRRIQVPPRVTPLAAATQSVSAYFRGLQFIQSRCRARRHHKRHRLSRTASSHTATRQIRPVGLETGPFPRPTPSLAPDCEGALPRESRL
jgi:hypothetical protein